jgi:hypothetical protein
MANVPNNPQRIGSFLISGRCRGRMLRYNRRDSFFSFSCLGSAQTFVQCAGSRGTSLWQRLFLRSFCKRRLKKKRRRTGSGDAKAINGITKIAKGVQKKVAGSGWGEGAKSMRIRVRTFLTAVGG